MSKITKCTWNDVFPNKPVPGYFQSRPSDSIEYKTQFDRILGGRTDQKACDLATAFCNRFESLAEKNLKNIFNEALEEKERAKGPWRSSSETHNWMGEISGALRKIDKKTPEDLKNKKERINKFGSQSLYGQRMRSLQGHLKGLEKGDYTNKTNQILKRGNELRK